jgi:uncharacterized short protein YbdD (DUF466 family)
MKESPREEWLRRESPREESSREATAVSRVMRLRGRLAAVAAQTERAYLQIFGIPDYARYLAHAAVHHPGEPPLSRREFCARAIERKFGRSGPKCC